VDAMLFKDFFAAIIDAFAAMRYDIQTTPATINILGAARQSSTEKRAKRTTEEATPSDTAKRQHR
jgi:hypothetical protein